MTATAAARILTAPSAAARSCARLVLEAAIVAAAAVLATAAYAYVTVTGRNPWAE